MGSTTALRLDASTGAIAAVLFLAGFAVQGTPPSPDESTGSIAEFLADKRGVILAGDVLIALASAAFLWFLGRLHGHLRGGGDNHLSIAAALGGAAGTAIIGAGVALQAGLVLNSADTSGEIVRLGFDAYNAMITIAAAPLAVAVGAASVAGARSEALPPWLWRAGLAIAVLQLATLPGLVAEAGFFAAGGPMALGAFVAIALWFAAVSVLMARRP